MDHLRYFKLDEDPFRSDPLEKFDVEIRSQQEARARLERGVRQGKGLLLLEGGVGAGKTRIARRVYEELEEELFEASMMLVLRRQIEGDWLLTRFAKQLGVEEPEAEREALIAQIFECLAIIHEDGRRALWIIDDAQGLANAETLSAITSLIRLEYEDRRILSVVLVGTSALGEAIRADAWLAHHVDVRVRVAALERDEAQAYLAGRIQAAGGKPEILLPGAIAALHELSEGAPGRMNALADNALYEAWLAGREQLTRSDIERAHCDLGWDEVAGSRVAPLAAPMPAGPMDGETTIQGMSLSGVAPSAGPGAAAESTEILGLDMEAPVAAGAPSPMAEATRVVLDGVDAPPKEGDEVDDLFMELLDD